MEGSNEEVASTNDDATYSKLSASRLGYFKDDFVHFFISGKANRMPPLINKGYYTRVASIRYLIDQFLISGGKQFISLGAGYDTNYWRLKQRFAADQSVPIFTTYFELDFPQVVKHKSQLIKKYTDLNQYLTDPKFEENGNIYSTDYNLLGVDLRDLSTLEKLLRSQGLDVTAPTMFLSECVLIYMNPTDSAKLIAWSSEVFSQSIFVIYEQIHPFDAFGEVMLKNLQSRGIPLASIKAYPDLNAQKKRLTDLGYTKVEALDMNQIFTELLDPSENQRVSRIEIFDEFEEWYMIQSHYCIILATQSKGEKDIWKGVTLYKNKKNELIKT